MCPRAAAMGAAQRYSITRFGMNPRTALRLQSPLHPHDRCWWGPGVSHSPESFSLLHGLGHFCTALTLPPPHAKLSQPSPCLSPLSCNASPTKPLIDSRKRREQLLESGAPFPAPFPAPWYSQSRGGGRDARRPFQAPRGAVGDAGGSGPAPGAGTVGGAGLAGGGRGGPGGRQPPAQQGAEQAPAREGQPRRGDAMFALCSSVSISKRHLFLRAWHGPGPPLPRPGPGPAAPRARLQSALRSEPLRSSRAAALSAWRAPLGAAVRAAPAAAPGPARPLGSAPRADSPGPAPLRSALRSARAAARSLPLRLPPGGNPAPLQPLRPPPRQPPPGPGTAPGPACGEAAGAGSARPRSVRGERGRPGWGTPADGTAAGLASLPRPPQPYGIGSCKSRVSGICGTAAVQTAEEGTHFAGLLCNAVRRSAGSTCRSPPAHCGTGTGHGSGQGCWDLH